MDLITNKSDIITTKSKSTPAISKKLNFRHFENDTDLQSIVQSFQKININIVKPYPICHPILKEQIRDPYFELIKRKHEHNMQMEHVRTSYRRIQKRKKTCAAEVASYKRLQTILDNDPDRFFNSDYNWYYTGGNLCVERFKNNILLLHTACGSKLYISELKKTDKKWTVHRKKVLAANTLDDNIYQLLSLISNDDTLINLARNKNHIDIRKITYNESNEITTEIIKKHNSHTPFVNICVNNFKNNEYATINAAQILKIWDVNQNRNNMRVDMCKNEIEKLDGNHFAQINFVDTNTCTYTNKIHLSLLDKRNSMNTTFAKEFLTKNELFTGSCSNNNNSNYLYVVTTLSVLQIDLRMYKIVNRWNHCFKKKPFLSDYTLEEGNDLICIASERPNEKLILGGKGETNFYIPTLLPSLSESLDVSLESQPQMNMSHIIRRRITLSTTGMKFVNENNVSSIFSANAIGDIFSYDLTNEINHTGCEHFYKWGDEILSNVEKSEPLYFVDRVFIPDLESILNIQTATDADQVRMKNKQECELQRVKKHLRKTTDKLKTALATAWDLDITLDDINSIDPDENVEQWLSTIQNESNIENEEYMSQN